MSRGSSADRPGGVSALRRRDAVRAPGPRTSPLPAQSSRTGQTSHSPMSIVTSRLSTATW